MRLRFPRLAAVTAATALSLATTIFPQSAAAQAGPCAFENGFAYLGGALGQDIVGNCRENERFNPLNGNVEQVTNNGLLFWRKCDNATAFTNGYLTWLNGPYGIQSRFAAGPLFEWEPIDPAAPPCQPGPVALQTPSVTAPVAPAPAPAPLPSAVPPPLPARGTCPPNAVSVRNTDLSFLNRQGVNYQCADAYHAKLLGTDFSGANLVEANLQSSELTRASFYGARLTLAVLVSTFSNSSKQVPGPNFGGADLKGAKLSTSKLPYSDFRYADLSNADLSRSVLTGSDMRGADLRAADLSQTNFTDANLTGAYLCGANTTGAIFLRAVGVSTSCG